MENLPGDIELYRDIYNTLFKLGVPPHMNGHEYLMCAIGFAISDPGYLRRSVCKLYSDVAREYGVNPKCVERSMRNAIEKTFDGGDYLLLNEFFGNSINPAKGKTTNSAFIAIVSQRIRMSHGMAAPEAEHA